MQIGCAGEVLQRSRRSNRYLATAVDDGNGGSKIFASQSNGQQRDKLTDSTTPGHRADLGLQRHHRVHRRDEHLLGRPFARPRRRSTRSPPVRGRSSHWCRAARTPMSCRRPARAVRCSTGAPSHGPDTPGCEPRRRIQRRRPDRCVDRRLVDAEPACSPKQSAARRHRRCSRLPDTTATPSDVTLDQNGKEAAYLSTNTAGAAELVVAQAAEWHAARDRAADECLAADALTWRRSDCIRLDVRSRSEHRGGSCPGRQRRAHAVRRSLPDANTTLQQFVQAQVGQNGQPDLDTLAALSAASVDAASSTPQNLSRAYIINTYLAAGRRRVGEHRVDRRSECRAHER